MVETWESREDPTSRYSGLFPPSLIRFSINSHLPGGFFCFEVSKAVVDATNRIRPEPQLASAGYVPNSD